MYYRAELEYMVDVLKRMGLKVMYMDMANPVKKEIDMGLRHIVGLDSEYENILPNLKNLFGEDIIHKVTDQFMCNYIFLLLPDAEKTSLLIGPYLAFEMNNSQLLKDAEKYGIPAAGISYFEECYRSIPVIKDETAIFALINGMGEILWGRGITQKTIDISHQNMETERRHRGDYILESEDMLQQMHTMELRYSYEQQLIDAVSKGLTAKVEKIMSAFSNNSLEVRSVDPVRNIKNYCIVSNTLLRKAAEKGGVHPFYLNRVSSDIARKIETIIDGAEGEKLLRSIARTYCKLVREYAVKKYSPIVRRTVFYIEANLSGDLSLKTLAESQSISSGYLSSVFHKETGKTLTGYVNERRMEHAAELFTTTDLQVQTVAQHCGMSDVNYFSKLFKKKFGVAPRKFKADS